MGEIKNIQKKKGNKKKRNKRFVNKRVIIIFLVSFIMLYFILLRGIPYLILSNAETATAKIVSYIDEEDGEAIIFRNEEVQQLSNNELKIKAKNGDKVSKNQIIATSKGSSNEEEKVRDINEKIDNYQEIKDNYEYYLNLEKVDDKELEDYIKRADKKLSESKEKIEDIRKDIQNRTDNNSKFFQSKIDSLKKEKEKLVEEKEKNIYKANISGIFSTETDGFEKKIDVNEIKTIDSKTFKNIYSEKEDFGEKLKKIKSFFVKEKKPEKRKIKIIDNSYWYIVIKIDDDYEIYEKYQEKDLGAMNFKLEDKNLDLSGKVINIKKSEGNLIITLELNSNIHEIYDLRTANVKLEKQKYKGLKVPKTALVEVSNQQGVYIKDVNGIVKFVPVNILYKDEKNIIVKQEPGKVMKSTINGEVKDLKVLELYDEVVVRGNLVKEDAILN